MLGIDRDAFPASELLKVDAMAATVEAQLDSMMCETLPLHPSANSHFVEEIDCALLQYASSNAFLNILPTPIFNDQGLNALQMKKLGKYQSRGTGTDDSDLGANGFGQ